jgi:hypothetical protein
VRSFSFLSFFFSAWSTVPHDGIMERTGLLSRRLSRCFAPYKCVTPPVRTPARVTRADRDQDVATRVAPFVRACCTPVTTTQRKCNGLMHAGYPVSPSPRGTVAVAMEGGRRNLMEGRSCMVPAVPCRLTPESRRNPTSQVKRRWFSTRGLTGGSGVIRRVSDPGGGSS